MEAAVRETLEESGLWASTDYHIIDKNLKIVSNYLVNGKAKKVVYFLAEAKHDAKCLLSDEHKDFKWLNLIDSCEIVNYDEMKRILNLAEEYIFGKE